MWGLKDVKDSVCVAVCVTVCTTADQRLTEIKLDFLPLLYHSSVQCSCTYLNCQRTAKAIIAGREKQTWPSGVMEVLFCPEWTDYLVLRCSYPA